MVLAVAVAATATTVWSAGETSTAQRDENAKRVAKVWFVSLMQGDTAATTSLSAVPFLFDGTRKITTHTELKKRYDRVVEEKGKRNLIIANPTEDSLIGTSHKLLPIVTKSDSRRDPPWKSSSN